MKLGFCSVLLSRNGIVSFIRNNKSQLIKISYYKVSSPVAFPSACSKWGGKGGGRTSPAALSTSYISHSTDYSSRNNNKVIIIIGIASVLIEKGY